MGAGASESTCSPRGIVRCVFCGVQSGRCLAGAPGRQLAMHWDQSRRQQFMEEPVRNTQADYVLPTCEKARGFFDFRVGQFGVAYESSRTRPIVFPVVPPKAEPE